MVYDGRKEQAMHKEQIDDDYIRSIQEGLEKILKELLKEKRRTQLPPTGRIE